MGRTDVPGFVVAVAAALALMGFGLGRGTWAVGGSDSSCYALTADAMSRGRLQPSTALVAEAPWPDASLTFAPGGFIPSPTRPDAASPICAPGMSVLMAPLATLFGRDAIFWLVPIAGALLVLSCFFIARALAGAAGGAAAAVLVAFAPIVLYQVVQPMNDVLTSALWLVAFALCLYRWHVAAGIVVGIAILVRPNLAPVALVVAMMPLFLQHDRASRATLRIAMGAVPGVTVMLALNQALYGSLVGSGYGDATRLFRLSNVDENLANFGLALWQTQYLVPLLGLAAPLLFIGQARRLSASALAAALIVVAIYLLYQPYPEWWYLRFLMPAIALLLTLTAASAMHVAARARIRGIVPLVVVVLAILGIRAAGARQAFQLQELEGRYRDAAQVVSERLPANAALITVWQSGGIRFHADREVVLWDAMDPAWLDRAVSWLASRGLQPFFLFERREEGEFRSRFNGASAFGALDWPPRFDLDRQVRIYDPADRDRFLAGETYTTDNLRSR